jgi:serine/threonine-protein kinase
VASLEEAEQPKREPARVRPPISGRAVAYGLVVVAIVLAAIPLLRGGFPWMPAIRQAESLVPQPTAVQPPVTPAPSAAPEPTAEPIAVDIEAVPWASIEVDGKYLGVTPLADVSLSPGLHIFRAQMPGGEIREHHVEVGATMRHVVFYADSEPESVEPEPEVAVEPVEPEPKVAAEPAPPPPIPEELPEIVVETIPHLEMELPEVAAEPGPAAPAPAPEPISVSINATPWASIEIDGDEIGITPLAGVFLAPGDHDFRVTMPDGTILERTVRIAPDNRHIAFSQ